MFNIITAYLAREIFKTSGATILVLYVILVSNVLGRLLADIADGDIPRQALWPVLFSQSISLLSLLLPIGFFIGIIFAFGRMYKDHEIVVMHACGIGYRDFYKPVLIVLTPLLLLSVSTSLWLNPMGQRYAQSIVDEAENLNEFQQIKPGQFNQSSSGEIVFYMESISDDRLELRDIIIGQKNRDVMVIETAATGRQKIDENSGDLFLVVGPGERYEGNAGQNDHKLIQYAQHGILIQNRAKTSTDRPGSEQLTLRELWDSNELADRIELHWRIAIPIVLLLLSLLAVPLAYIAPRQGRFGKVGYALLVYVVYLNLIAVTRAQLETGVLPMALNFWWVHGLFLGLAIMLLYRRTRGRLFSRAAA